MVENSLNANLKLEKLVSRKKPKYDLETFSGLRRLKHLGVRIITCG